MRKTIINILITVGLFVTANTTLATVINFDNTAPASPGILFTGGNYTESGFTLGTGGCSSNCSLYLYNGNTYSSDSFNNTDFLAASGLTGGFVQMTSSFSGALFSLQSFYVKTNLSSINVSANLDGGGTLSQIINVNASQWSLVSLTGWNDLTTFSIGTAPNGAFVLDNITVNEPGASVAEPSATLLLCTALAGLGLSRRGKIFSRTTG